MISRRNRSRRAPAFVGPLIGRLGRRWGTSRPEFGSELSWSHGEIGAPAFAILHRGDAGLSV